MLIERFSENARAAIELASRIAVKGGHSYVTPSHMLLALLEPAESPARRHLEMARVDLARLQELQRRRIARSPRAAADATDTPITRDVEAAFIRADESSAAHRSRTIGVGHLLVALWEDATLRADLESSGATAQTLAAVTDAATSSALGGAQGLEHYEALARYTIDLTARAREGRLDKVIGRDKEIRQVVEVLSRRLKNNPVIVGEPGVGKTAIAEGLAQRIASGAVPESLLHHAVLSLDIGQVVAGARMRGEFEERIKRILDEVAAAGNVLLFIDEMHMLVGAGGPQGGTDAAGLLKPALSRGELRCIGATTLVEYRKHIEKDAALSRRFQLVLVEEPSRDEAVRILLGLRETYEQFHGVRITDDAVYAAVDLSSRYISDRFLPDKALDLVDHSAATVRVARASGPHDQDQLEGELAALEREGVRDGERLDLDAPARGSTVARDKRGRARDARRTQLESELATLRARPQPEARVDELEVAEAVSRLTGIPVNKLLDTEADRLLHLEEILGRRVIGQTEAVKRVAQALRRARTGMVDPKRPLGSFLFLGPTGVGKTELSKAVAEIMFGSERALLRLDMSEFMEKHSVARLVGAPPGYVGFEDGGTLTNRVKRRPYSAILFDEVEKAHPDVFNLLLQVLDEGHLTDGQGATVDFKSTIIILTSNLGGAAAGSRTHDEVMNAVRKYFRPEFLNRLDDIVSFDALGPDQMRPIVEIQAARVAELLDVRHCTLDVRPEALSHLAAAGYDPEYGARPLKRLVRSLLQDPLAERIIKGELPEGSHVVVHGDARGVQIAVEPQGADKPRSKGTGSKGTGSKGRKTTSPTPAASERPVGKQTSRKATKTPRNRTLAPA